MADSAPVSPQQIARLLAEREELLAANEQLRKENGQLQQNREQLNQERDQLRDEVKELKRLIFGSKKERFVPAAVQNQLSLLLGEDLSLPAVPLRQTVHYERIVKQVTKKASRQLFPAHLPRVEVLIEPTEDVSGMRGPEIRFHLRAKSEKRSRKSSI